MSKAVRSHIKFLNFLQTSSKKQRRSVLLVASKNEVNVLSEIILNLLKGNLSLSQKEKIQLKKYRSSFHLISNHSTSLSIRRKYLLKLLNIIPILIRSVIKVLRNNGQGINFTSKSKV